MGTRSLTVVEERWEGGEKTEVLVMYRQMDGYPTGHGDDLATFLKDFKICNGIGVSESPTKLANGMGCLAAQIVAHFKENVGGIYLHPSGTRDCGEEYIYTVSFFHTEVGFNADRAKGSLRIRCYDTYKKKVIYEGGPARFNGERLEAKGEEV